MGTADTATLNKLREKFLSASLTNDGSKRYGLFSSPLAGVWGDGNYDFQKQKKVGPDNKVITQPRGLYPGASRSGKTGKSYFSDVGYTTIGDPYIDPSSMERKYQNAKKKKFPHDSNFRPADGMKSDPTKALFEHMKEDGDTKKSHRREDGKVAVSPRNIFTSPPKKLFGKSLDHMKDEYDRKRELDYQAHQEHKKKLQEQPFRSVSPGNKPFFSDKQTFSITTNPVPTTKPPKAEENPKKFHDAPFKPASPSKNALNRFPEYKSDPLKIAVRKVEAPADKKDPFKPTNTADYKRPTPSISLNKTNLKYEMSRISSSLF